MTSAIRSLNKTGATFTTHMYPYADGSGASGAAELLGLDPHLVIKTLIMETDSSDPLCVLMHGDEQVSTKALARLIGTKSVRVSDPIVAQKRTGYQVGGTSPFGMRTDMPIYLQATVLDYGGIYVNGGRRGLLLCMESRELVSVLQPTLVHIMT